MRKLILGKNSKQVKILKKIKKYVGEITKPTKTHLIVNKGNLYLQNYNFIFVLNDFIPENEDFKDVPKSFVLDKTDVEVVCVGGSVDLDPKDEALAETHHRPIEELYSRLYSLALSSYSFSEFIDPEFTVSSEVIGLCEKLCKEIGFFPKYKVFNKLVKKEDGDNDEKKYIIENSSYTDKFGFLIAI